MVMNSTNENCVSRLFYRPRLKGCESEVASLLDARWKSLAYDWVVESNVQKRTSSSRPIAIDDRRV
jgi:hypothetical protein